MEEHNSTCAPLVNELENDFACDPNSDLSFDVTVFSENSAKTGPNADRRLLSVDTNQLSEWDIDMLVWDFNSNCASLEVKKAVADMLGRDVSFIDLRLTALRRISMRLCSVVLSLADSAICNTWKRYVDKQQSLYAKPCPSNMDIDMIIVKVLAQALKIDKDKLHRILKHIQELKHYLHFAGIHRDTAQTSNVPVQPEQMSNERNSPLPTSTTIPAHWNLCYTTSEDVALWKAWVEAGIHPQRGKPALKSMIAQVATDLNRTEGGVNQRLNHLRAMAVQAQCAVGRGTTLRVGEQCSLWRLYSQRVWPLQDNSTHVDERVIVKLAEKLRVSHSTLRAELQNIRSIKWYLLLVGIHSDRCDTSPCNEPTCAEKVEPLPTHETSSEYGTDNAWSPTLAFLVWFGTPPPFVFKLHDEAELWRIYVEHQHNTTVNICGRLQELSRQLGCQFAQAREHLSKLVKLSNGDDAQQHSAGRPFTTAEDNIIQNALCYTPSPQYCSVLQSVSQRLSCAMGAVAARHMQLKTLSALETVRAEVDTAFTKNNQCILSEDTVESSEDEGNYMLAYFSTECESSDEEMMH